MQRKIHMRDQVSNKIDGIMNHYKPKPIKGFMFQLKKLVKQAAVLN
jgi:hypothetical protein